MSTHSDHNTCTQTSIINELFVMTIIKAKKTSLEIAVLVVGLYAAAIDLAKLCQSSAVLWANCIYIFCCINYKCESNGIIQYILK